MYEMNRFDVWLDRRRDPVGDDGHHDAIPRQNQPQQWNGHRLHHDGAGLSAGFLWNPVLSRHGWAEGRSVSAGRLGSAF